MNAQIADWRANPWPHADRYFVYSGPTQVNVQAPAGTTDTFDLTSEGMEFELVMNPKPNWRLMANISKVESMQSNTGTTMLKFLNERVPLWERTPNLPQTETLQGTVEEAKKFLQAAYYQVANRDGTVLPEVRKWRFNAVTNYRFVEGRLKGFNVGGAYRWQDRAGIGYESFFDSKLAIYRINTGKPYFGPRRDNVDFFAGYRMRILSDKTTLRLQLNVRNLLDDDDLVPVYANPDGEKVAFQIPQTRLFQLSASIEF